MSALSENAAYFRDVGVGLRLYKRSNHACSASEV